MRKISLTILTILFCLTSNVAWSADFQKGLTAAQSGDFATALREWKPLAKQGDVAAQYNLSLMHQKGQGVKQNYKTAVKWFRLSAEQGDADAQSNLGVMYGTGQGVLQDYVRAHMWFNIASISGESKKASKNRPRSTAPTKYEFVALSNTLAKWNVST